MTPNRHPPHALESLATFLVRNRSWREATLGDLAEEFAARAGRQGQTAAVLWYLWQLGWLAAEGTARTVGDWLRDLFAIGQQPVRSFAQELRLALRSLLRQPLAAIAVILTLAVGLGANASAFSMLQVLLLRPYPFPDADRIAVLSENSADFPFPQESVSAPNFADWRGQATSFTHLAAFEWGEANVSDGAEPETLMGFRVTGDFFDVFHVRPSLGRLLGGEDETKDTATVVIGDAFWHGHFGARPDIVGTTLRIDGQPFVIVGVASPGFNFPNDAQFWTPYALTAERLAARTKRDLTVVGHLRDGVSLPTAVGEMQVIGARLLRQYPKENYGFIPRVQSLARGMGDVAIPSVLALIEAASLLVLLIGGTNIASLLLARGWDRQREVAVRLALGANRLRIVRQLLVESLVLGAVAVPFALLTASVALHFLRAALPARTLKFVAGWEKLGVDARVVWFTVAASLLSAALLGLFPALQASRTELIRALRAGGRSVTSGGRLLVRRVFVVAELALVLPLLVSAGLATLAATRFATGPQGYDPTGVETMAVVLPGTDVSAGREFVRRLLDEAARIPGVSAVSTASAMPTGITNPTRSLEVEGRPPADPNHRPSVPYRVVSPAYFATMRIPVVDGRAFSTVDAADGQPVVIVTQSLASAYWPHATAIGRRLRVFSSDQKASLWMTVVGVVGDVVDDWYDRRNTPTLFVPEVQRPALSITLLARTSGDPTLLGPALRHALHAVDRDQSETLVISLDQSLADRTSGLRVIATIMGGIGGVALLLAAVGIYSLMAYYVSQRRAEIGIRMALGATQAAVVRLTLGQTARLSAIGLGIGSVLAVLAGIGTRSALFGIIPLNASLVVELTLVLALIAFASTLAPLRQALRVTPSVTLRVE